MRALPGDKVEDCLHTLCLIAETLFFTITYFYDSLN